MKTDRIAQAKYYYSVHFASQVQCTVVRILNNENIISISFRMELTVIAIITTAQLCAHYELAEKRHTTRT